jgi:hypothetical protein
MGSSMPSIRVRGWRPGKRRPDTQRGQTQNHHCLLGNREPTRCLFPSASGLGFAAFFFIMRSSTLPTIHSITTKIDCLVTQLATYCT